MSSSLYLAKHAAFFDELQKIAEASPEEKKEALKKRVIGIGVQALGAGLGYATASALHNELIKNPTKIWLNMSPERKYQILGGLKTVAALGSSHAAKELADRWSAVRSGKDKEPKEKK